MQQYNNQYQQNAQQQQYGAGLGLQGLQMANQSAQNLGTLGGLQYQQNMGINQMQNQYGLQQQAQVQQDLTNKYQDYLNSQNYPYKQLGFMSDMVRGLPLGSQTTQSMYPQTPGPSTVQTLAGLGGAAYGFGKSGLFGGKEGGLMTSYAEGGEVKTYAGDSGSVTSEDNIKGILDKLSDRQLAQAKKTALATRDVEQANMIDAEMAERSSIRGGLGGAYNQIPEDRQEEMMYGANGGIVAFAGGGTYGKEFRSSLDTLTGMKPPPSQTPEEFERGAMDRLPMLQRMMGPDVTEPFAQELKADRDKLPAQMEKDQGLAFAMSSLGLLTRQPKRGESKKQQFVSGIGEAGLTFAGEVGRLKKENREADNKIRQSQLLIATAQQQRKEGLAGKAIASQEKAEDKIQDAYKQKVEVQAKSAQLLGTAYGNELQAETSRYSSDNSLKGQMASAAVSREGNRLQASKPSSLKEGTDVFYAKLRPLYPDKSDADVRALAQQKYLEMTKTGLPGVEAKIGATREENARERAAGRMTTDPIALKAAREKDVAGLDKRRKEILNEERANPSEQEPGAASDTPPQKQQQQQQATLPPAAVSTLKEGQQTTFANGQVWTLQNGKPVRVK
jgi:hypothetical protein